MNKFKIVAVVVTYNPEVKTLRSLLSQLGQHASVIIDNGSVNDLEKVNHEKNLGANEIIRLHENLGLAAAQNIGISWARDRGADFILLMDQDSIPQPGMIEELLQACSRLMQAGIKVAAVGCRYQDADGAHLSGFVRFSGMPGRRAISCGNNQQVVECDFLIASGTLIPMIVIDRVGLMDEGLFIDHVDTEWCLRARSMGYSIFGACAAVMQHELGTRRKRLWFIRWRDVAVHTPFRYYYMVRNSVLLHRRDYPDKAWRAFDIQRFFQMLFFFGLFVPGRATRLRMIFKGLYDGLRGVSGKLEK